MPDFSLAAMSVNAHLHLPPLTQQPICHGYSCGCCCRDCRKREDGVEASVPAPQPWERAA